MAYTSTERQREYKERMYNAGFKQTIVWVKRKEGKTPEKMSLAEFVRQLRKKTAGMNGEELTRLFNLLLKIVKSRKEEEKLKKNK